MARKRYYNNRKNRRSYSRSQSRVYNIAYGAQLHKEGKTEVLNKILGGYRVNRSAEAGVNRAKNGSSTKKFF